MAMFGVKFLAIINKSEAQDCNYNQEPITWNMQIPY